jgi:glycosyltransferase involved in cell wall biosynthesis
MPDLRIALIVPCFNEAPTVAEVVNGFRQVLPGAVCHVFDNHSTDQTAALAQAAGAVVHRVHPKGKGHVVRRMLADVEADIYIMVDGDATYDPATAVQLVQALVEGQLDMVVGSRVNRNRQTLRWGRHWGNRLLTVGVRALFGHALHDVFSGYRAFSRRFAKSFAADATGFETEIEMTVHALTLRLPVAEVPTRYRPRPAGSVSKLNTWRDGLRMAWALWRLFRTERPGLFFALGFGLCQAGALATWLAWHVQATDLQMPLPQLLGCLGLVLLGVALLLCGAVLDGVALARTEVKRLAYLQTPATGHGPSI